MSTDPARPRRVANDPGGSLWLSAAAKETISLCHFNARISGKEVGGFLEGTRQVSVHYLVHAARNDTAAHGAHWLQLRKPSGTEFVSGRGHLIGIWHSHVNGRPEPSNVDIQGAAARASFLGHRR
jgi:proteasome lid subunit RPN8/RPN11